jgi:beta-lactamase regulating signal transducer with metallopeptidase domain
MTAITSSFANWATPHTTRALAWALLHFLWQGIALAALAAAAMALVRRASVRYLLGMAVLVLMLASPIATFFYYAHEVPGERITIHASEIRAAEGLKAKEAPATTLPLTSSPHFPSAAALPWLVEAWLVGVAFFSLRMAGGFLLIERQRRREATALSPRLLAICRELQQRLGLARAIAYRGCMRLQAPAVIGWFRPVVFLPLTAITGLSEEQLQSVIAHELAHIRRFDPFLNLFQVWVETLLFYHPAVWWLNKKIRAEREHCCDEVAVSVCGNAVEYARALTLMEEWRSAPALAMAANRGPLTDRILRVLGLNTSGDKVRGIGLTASILCLTAALVAGNALLNLAHPPSVRAAALWQSAAAPVPNSSKPAASSTAKPSPAHPQSSEQASPTVSSSAVSSYIDGMKAAGLTDLTIDDLVALKTQGVTPDYVREMHELGLHPDADGFVGLKVQGITPEYIKELRTLGFNPDADQAIGLKVQGVTADYVRGMKEVGIEADADGIIGLKVQGVTPDYVRELRALGLKVDTDDVIGLKVQRVTPAYVKGLQDQGLHPSADDVVGMRVQGVTPEYIRDIRALGLNPSADDFVGMKVQGVTPDYIKTLQSAGFKPSVDDVVGAKVQGITPEFIEEARKHGFKDLTIEKLIELKNLEVMDKGEI